MRLFFSKYIIFRFDFVGMYVQEPTVKDIAESWAQYKKGRVKPSTESVYLRTISNHILPIFGDMTYSEVFNRQTIEPFCIKSLNLGMSTTTVKSIYRILVMLMNHAGDRFNLPLHNLHVDWPISQRPRYNIEVYTMRELMIMTDYMQSNITPGYLGILLVISSGMRIGEVCGLTFGDVDINNNIITISKTLNRVSTSKGHTEIIISTPKTASGNRRVPLLPDLTELLCHYKSIYPSDAYVCSCSSHPLEPRRMSSIYHDLIVNKLKFTRCLKFHALRHSFATYLIQCGAEIKAVSALMGHSKVATTLDLYTHPSDDTKRRIVNTAIGEIFKKHKCK